MIRIAIVEDDSKAAELLTQYLKKFENEQNVAIKATAFGNGTSFLYSSEKIFDLVFMDIDMPGMNGIEVSHRLRETDDNISIVFLTNLKQYAISGYKVNALDFLVKPLSYLSFETLMKKFLKHMQKSESGGKIFIKSSYCMKRILIDDIDYIDVYLHGITIHQRGGEEEKTWGNLSDYEKLLPADRFIKCSGHCIVNLDCVKKIEGSLLTLESGQQIPISRNKKSELTTAFMRYIGY